MDPITAMALSKITSMLMNTAGSYIGSKLGSPRQQQGGMQQGGFQGGSPQGGMPQSGMPQGSFAYSPYSGQQQDAMRQMLQMSLGGMKGMQEPIDFGPIAEEAQRSYQEDIVPGLAERFASQGEGGLSSSAFRGSLARAGTGLKADLASRKAQFMESQRAPQLGFLQNMLSMGLRPQQQFGYAPPQPGRLSSFAGTIGHGLAQGFGQEFGDRGPSFISEYLKRSMGGAK